MNEYLRDDLKRVLKDIEYIHQKELEGREIYLDHLLEILDSSYKVINRVLNVDYDVEKGGEVDIQPLGQTQYTERGTVDEEVLKDIGKITNVGVGDETEEEESIVDFEEGFRQEFVDSEEEHTIEMTEEVVVEKNQYLEEVLVNDEKEMIIQENIGGTKQGKKESIVEKIKKMLFG